MKACTVPTTQWTYKAGCCYSCVLRRQLTCGFNGKQIKPDDFGPPRHKPEWCNLLKFTAHFSKEGGA